MADQGPITSAGQHDKYIGLALAISSSFLIGSSFIITKLGLMSAADGDGLASSDTYSYLKNRMWWAGMCTMVVGEAANFAAYTFAPPILVTPLGALSVLIGAVLASFFLNERLGPIGVSGCSLCLVGSVIIILHAPEDRMVNTVDEILEYALQPGFLFYCFFVLVFCLYMIWVVAPKQGTKNPLVYISICSLAGSVSVMAVKGFGVALKLTFAGNNQLWRPGTWVFAITVVVCIAVQMAFFNKALDIFPTTLVNPSYFVGFSTSTIIASTILFHGLNTTGGSNTVSLLCGLYTISLGVYLLNISRSENARPAGARHSLLETGILGQRLSLSSRLSEDEPTSPRRLNGRRVSNDIPARRSAGYYRPGGAVVGGVEPIFEYREDAVAMDQFDEDEDESADERKGLVRGGDGVHPSLQGGAVRVAR